MGWRKDRGGCDSKRNYVNVLNKQYELMKQCLQETIPVVDEYKIKPFTTNDIPSSNK